MNIIENSDVLAAFKHYPEPMPPKLLFLRQLVFEVASDMPDSQSLEETLKWNEPAYQTHNGSTVRIAWKKSAPQQYAMYFHCKTRLVDTFRELYSELFRFEGNRAIVFNENDEIPINELKHCISLSLSYHRIKHLPLLGAALPGK
ncbi:hypothetical protein MNBD_GAMMA11-3315 [hydrothermal vent metagenome]|uniref:YdhG-like domain-containing protein n=1 Tax=hydrothermal vent metagenome TaxID=652676 RepID=A0A3B0XJU2_9ZZZZ